MLVKERLGIEETEESVSESSQATPPRVFLSYTSADNELAKKTAEALQAAGIETWWDQWCIYPGDSLRRKIDEGIGGCTHFLVLLTPRSIDKPWVNQEMDAGLVRSLKDQCKFLPVRSDLPTDRLPPLLSGLHSPSITTDQDIAQLISDIYGVSRKPPRGAPPAPVARSAGTNTGYSPAANAIARLFVERSELGLYADPQYDIEDIMLETGLSREDTKDGLYELSRFFKESGEHALVQGALFTEFDRYWKDWIPADDARRLAADLVNDPSFPHSPEAIATQYGWGARRLNSALHYLLDRRLIDCRNFIGSGDFAVFGIRGNDQTRRFVKGKL